MHASIRTRGPLALAALLVLAFVLQCVAFVRANGQTYDEALTIASGSAILRGELDPNREHPPLARVLSALAVEAVAPPELDVEAWQRRRESAFALGRAYLYEGGAPHRKVLLLGRAPFVLCATALVALVGLFAARLWGARAGLLALALAAFDPNLVAHGSLASHDGLLALFVTLALFGVAEFSARPRARWLVVAGLALGLACVTKFSGLALAPAIVAAFAIQALAAGRLPVAWMDVAPPPRGPRALLHAAGNLALVLGVALLVVRLAYAGPGLGAYLDGVRAQRAHQAAGHPAFFLGEVSSKGWAWYFPVALALKSPPLGLLLALASLVGLRVGAPLGRAWGAIVAPAALLAIAVALVRVDIGVRYALPLVPLLLILASRVATFPAGRLLGGRLAPAALALALVHHAVAAIRVAPHDLAFFSDLAGGPARGQRYLADSNLDWGQDVTTLARWAERARPARLFVAYFGTASLEAHGLAYTPAPNACPHPPPSPARAMPPGGRGEFLAVSAMNAQGVFFPDPSAYRWLERRAPVARLGHSIAIYDVTNDADAHRELARLYARYGPRELAAARLARAAEIDGAPSPAP